MKSLLLIILGCVVFLAGCGFDGAVGGVKFKEEVCVIPETKIHVASSYGNSSHPLLNNGNYRTAAAMSVPAMGYIWGVGSKYHDGIMVDWYEMGHEYMHIAHYRCPDIFADPDRKDYFMDLFREAPRSQNRLPHGVKSCLGYIYWDDF